MFKKLGLVLKLTYLKGLIDFIGPSPELAEEYISLKTYLSDLNIAGYSYPMICKEVKKGILRGQNSVDVYQSYYTHIGFDKAKAYFKQIGWVLEEGSLSFSGIFKTIHIKKAEKPFKGSLEFEVVND